MKTKKTTLAFTAEELDIIYFALNLYSLDNIHNSKTWGSTDELIAHGGPDIWHGTALAAGSLQSRIYRAENRLALKANPVTVED